MSTTQLQRRLKSRHIAMIAIGGSIGTGIFIASGNAIHTAGPGGAVLAFAIIGLMVYFLMTSLGEMSALIPITGTFCDYSSRFVDPAFGFAQSYNYWFSWLSAAAVDLSSSILIMKYWFPHTLPVDWGILFFALIFIFNACAVGLYGETEYWFSLIKVMTIIIFIIVSILVIIGLVGNNPIGFHNLTIGDAPFHQGWLGILTVLLVAGFSFQGTEIFGVTAGEAKDPAKSIPRAVRTIFWRILLFYVASIAVISFIIPYTDPSLVNSSETNIAMSPFTIVFREAGLRSAATIMNIIILTSVLSAANASFYTATRMLWHIAKQNNAPRIFSRTSRQGIPLPALIITAIFIAAAFMTSILGSGKVFIWLISLSGLSGFITWVGIAISHYRFRRAYVLQGHELSDLPYRSKLFPLGPLFALLLCVFIILGQQFSVQESFNWGSFVGTYVGIPVFILLYLAYKFYHRTKIVPLALCQFTTDDKT